MLRVGVFDSGLGGLTIVSSIAQSFKDLEIFYIADTLFAPYGEKSFEQVLKHSLDISDYKPGVYILKIGSDKHWKESKFIKK